MTGLCGRYIVATTLAATVSQVVSVQTPKDVQGVWQVAEVTTKDGTNSKPQPGLYIFTAAHYSIVQVSSDRPRPLLPSPIGKATAAEIVAALGPSFNAQAGSYAVSGTSLVLRPFVAKSPSVMKEGTSEQYNWKNDGKVLTLSVAGGQSMTVRLSKVE